MISFSDLALRATNTFESIFNGEYGQQDVFNSYVCIDHVRDPDNGKDTYAVSIRLHDGSIASVLTAVGNLKNAIGLRQSAQFIMNNWLEKHCENISQ